jgi:formate dehydrogenase iron-sulfur subunit
MTRVFILRDSGALAVGAEAVAQAIAGEAEARNIPLEIVRTGSRGLYWLEPMIVIETAIGRIDSYCFARFPGAAAQCAGQPQYPRN